MHPTATLPIAFPKETEIPESYHVGAPQEQREYLVDGNLLIWDGPLNPVYSPVCIEKDGQVEPRLLGYTPLLTAKESLEALEAAVMAYDLGMGRWPSMHVGERIAHVEKFLAGMRTKRTEVVNLLMWEIGKSLKDSEKEFDRTCQYIVDTIQALKELDREGSRFEEEEGILAQIRRVPLGVALCMGPYNYPLNETFSTLIPALIMGNPVVFKPAKFGVLLIRPLLEIFRDSFPAGVVNIIYGQGRVTVGPLMESGKVDVFAFIGTNKGANDLKRMHPKPHRLKAILGLDAKNPGIILPDADLEVAVSEAVTGTLSFNGQRCTALKLLLVHQSIAEEFTRRVTAEIEKLISGMPWTPGVHITPLPEKGKIEYLHELVNDATSKGARVLNAGGGQSHGTYFHPAVLYPVNAEMRVYHEEQFGPIVPIMPYDDLEEAIAYVRHSNFGQQISVFGRHPATVGRLVDAFANQVGRININTQCQRGPDVFPFNGRKDSAEGTLSVRDALRVFSIRTLVATRHNTPNKDLIGTILHNRHSRFLSTDYLF
jgi:glyceraldehyde-3-phosphate dehydrogenase (NADP+)